MKIRKKFVMITFILLIFLLILFFPYLKAEVLTVRYGKEFAGLQKQTNMLSESKYYKVISYSYDSAEVFYVSDSGNLLTFKKDSNGEWKYSKWKTIWSTSGSASEFMWPYYR